MTKAVFLMACFLFIAAGVMIFFASQPLISMGESASAFCKANDAGSAFRDHNYNGLDRGLCVKIIDNQTVEVKEIIYIELIGDWRFESQEKLK